VVGTPNFVAPERIAGGADDGRSDVFSLGGMLYEMICGATPWPLQEQLRMAWGLAQTTTPQPMSHYRRGVSPELEALVARSLAWQADNRPTAGELAAELERLANSLDDGPADRVHLPSEEIAATMQTPPPAERQVVSSMQWLIDS
jgi:serine/threonine protein kinase